MVSRSLRLQLMDLGYAVFSTKKLKHNYEGRTESHEQQFFVK